MCSSDSVFSLSDYGIDTTVRIGSGTVMDELEVLKGQKIYLAVSRMVFSLRSDLAERLPRDGSIIIYLVDDGESCKSLSGYGAMIGDLLLHDFPRGGIIAYIGGGTLGDLSGFVSSTYKRGTGFAAFPTTLLSMVDSSIGGKNALDYDSLKNAVGTIWNPSRVVIDLDFLDTLPRDELYNGISEIVKYSILADPDLISSAGFRKLAQRDVSASADIIERSIHIKSMFLKGDVDDRKGGRIFLNFGHTFGHALEAVTHNAISHGRSVAAGMIFETQLAFDLGLCSETNKNKVVSMVVSSGIDLPGLHGIDPSLMMKYVLNDKKSKEGKLIIPFAVRPGKVDLAMVSPLEFEKSLMEFMVSGYEQR